jgi:hypothetical protein
MPFNEARGFVHDLGLKGRAEWGAYCKGLLARRKGEKPESIPASPERVYPSRWQGWGDWLGTGTIAPKNRRYRSFRESRAFARALNLRGSAEWFQWSRGGFLEKGRRPMDIPSAPWLVYRDKGWRDMGDWLGTGFVATFSRKYWPFRRARAFVRSLGLRSQAEWLAFASGRLQGRDAKPSGIPSAPENIYAGRGWAGIGDWLGTSTVAHANRSFRPFRKVRAWARSLTLKSSAEWATFSVGRLPEKGRRPADIPSNPSQKYRGEGWKGFKDWLGTARKRPSPKL